MNSSMCLYLKMDYLKAHGRRVNAFGQWVSLHRSNRVINLPNLTLRELEPKCVPLLFLGWLPETRRSAIGQFFPLSWVTLQEVFAKVNSTGQVFFSFVNALGSYCVQKPLEREKASALEYGESLVIFLITQKGTSHLWELLWNKLANWQAISQFLFVASGACATHLRAYWNQLLAFLFKGKLYWYDLSNVADCESVFPVFLMFTNGVLNGFGWVLPFKVDNPRFVHPTKESFPVR